MVPLSFAGEEWLLSRSGALFWPRESALLVADLHLEKGSFFASRGQMIPPYDSRETLGRLAGAIRDTGARRVFALGDNFHDAGGPQRMEPHAAGMLAALTRATEWVWISGNHDGGTDEWQGGTVLDELECGLVVLRHEARPGELKAELSGHFHPRLRIVARGRRITRPCAIRASAGPGGGRMILPAFGAFTGGMDAADPAIRQALQPAREIDALVLTAERIATFPLWRDAA